MLVFLQPNLQLSCGCDLMHKCSFCWHFDWVINFLTFFKLIINPNDYVFLVLRKVLGCDDFLKVVYIKFCTLDGLWLHFFHLKFGVWIEQDLCLFVKDGIVDDWGSSFHNKFQQVKWLSESNFCWLPYSEINSDSAYNRSGSELFEGDNLICIFFFDFRVIADSSPCHHFFFRC